MHATLVLDANVVQDALHFRAPSVTMLAAAWAADAAICLGDAHTLTELERVSGYASLNIAPAQADALLAICRQRIRPVPGSGSPCVLPRCRDPDDQPFLALAARGQAEAPASRDRKLLELSCTRRSGHALPFDILRPAALASAAARRRNCRDAQPLPDFPQPAIRVVC